ncbi:helix-turn-helix domain-containing protein [Sinorhizobium meliloti]|uniref:helix-turn-helix domain-containing protein n=1 Tax=Rhizobium meliloti TaxID=382 RepID=UPI0013E3D906|nr:helix-turn-helix transcriptional regulator [Sinorhizobium meliloti]
MAIATTPMSELADRIREAANIVGGLNKLAEQIGVPRRTMGHWLQGRKPKPEALQDIARVAGVDLTWLLTGEGDKHSSFMRHALRGLERGSVADPAVSADEAELAFQQGMAKLRAARGEAPLFDDIGEPEIDESLMEDLAKMVTSVYREAKQHLRPEKVTVEATRLFNGLRQLVDLEDDEGVPLALALLRHKLRRRLEKAAAEPGTGKRSA